MRTLPATAAVFGLALTLSGAAAADIYSYEKDGVVHFTNNRGSAAGRGAKLYIKSVDGRGGHGGGAKVRPGVTPVAPSDRDVLRYAKYDDWIREAGALYQIPEQLVRAIIKCESDFDARAVSPAGARGLMQLMPETAARMQVKDISDPRENIFGGTRYLRILANNFSGELDLTIAGYNAGEGAVMRFGGIPPYAETRDYVVCVTKFYRRYRSIPDAIEASIGKD